MTFFDSVSTLRAAIELKSVFDQIQAAEKAGNLSPEEKKRLEEQAAEKGLQALFKVFPSTFIFFSLTNICQGTKLEVESILRETCDRLLSDPAISREKAQLRAVALQILGEAYMNVKKDAPEDGSDYVKIDTKSSRAREGGRTWVEGVAWQSCSWMISKNELSFRVLYIWRQSFKGARAECPVDPTTSVSTLPSASNPAPITYQWTYYVSALCGRLASPSKLCGSCTSQLYRDRSTP